MKKEKKVKWNKKKKINEIREKDKWNKKKDKCNKKKR